MVDLTGVTHIFELTEDMQTDQGISNDVNDFLAMDDWILLSVTESSATGDDGRHSWAVYHLGWKADLPPDFPKAEVPNFDWLAEGMRNS